MYINLKPTQQVHELEHFNPQRHEQVCDLLTILLWQSSIVYNSSKPKPVFYHKSPPELMNKKPIFK